MESEPESISRAAEVAAAIGGMGVTCAIIAETLDRFGPSLKILAESWRQMMIEREQLLRERLGIWRYLSSEWRQLRRYVGDSSNA